MKAIFSKALILSAIFAAGLCLAATAHAGDVEIEVAVDKAEITVGDPVQYSITLTWDPKVQVGNPMLEENLGALVVRERKPGKTETLPDRRQKRTDVYVITSYMVGEYKIPPPVVGYTPAGGELQTLAGEPVMLKVKSVAPEDAKDIRDIKPPRAVPRDLTKPLIYIGAGIAGAILAAILIVYLVRRSRRKRTAEPAEPPYDRAARRLAACRDMPRGDHKQMKAFYVELSELLRDYLDGRFGVPAPLLTTSQLRAHLDDGAPAELGERDGFLGILTTADFVKFAKYEPGEEAASRDIEAAGLFLESTRPAEPAGDAKAEGGAA